MSLVLLGCRVDGSNALSGPAERRAQRAIAAFRAGLSDHILACGGKTWAGVRETDALCAFLRDAGIPDDSLEREGWSRSTRQNAHYAAQLLLPRGLRRVGIVTCDWHMSRALRNFWGAGFEALPLPAESPPGQHSTALRRFTREGMSLGIDYLMTRGFSRV